MKNIAVAGVGGNIGGYLTKGSNDVILICISWKENAEAIKKG